MAIGYKWHAVGTTNKKINPFHAYQRSDTIVELLTKLIIIFDTKKSVTIKK